MNQYSRTLIQQFNDPTNIKFIRDRLLRVYSSYPRACSYIHDNFDTSLINYMDRMSQELSMSDPMPGVTIEKQLNCSNTQFIMYMSELITDHVFGGEEATAFIVRDDAPTSRRGVIHHQRPPNEILEIWRNNPAKGCELRSDCAGDITSGINGNPYYGASDRHLNTGIIFCDQSHLGMQNHVDQYENTSYKIALNTVSHPHELVPFGVSTPASDTRLLQRSIFRRNENGVESGILNREARLQRRYLERDISEGLRPTEKGFMQRGHDMTSLYKRVDYKRAVAAKYNPYL